MAVIASTKGLKDKDLARFLYLNPLENFDDIMDRAEDHMLVNEALQSIDNDTPPSSNKKANKGNKGQKWYKKPRPPPPPKTYILLNIPNTENLNHLKEERYELQPPPPM